MILKDVSIVLSITVRAILKKHARAIIAIMIFCKFALFEQVRRASFSGKAEGRGNNERR